jgi:hypothetical protein
MPRYRRKFNASLKRALMLVAIPLALTSTGYALFSQQLSVHGTGNVPNYTSSQNLSVSYTQSSAPQGQSQIITTTVTIKNNSGTRGVTAWNSTFDLPSGYSNLSCTNATCSQASNVNTAVNTGTNGLISPGGTVTYTFVFKYTLQTYAFTTITVSGTLAPVYQTMAGLTMTAVAGSRSTKKGVSTWPYTITVSNNTGQNLSDWRIIADWSSTETVASMPTTVNYTTTTTNITITSKSAINTGTNFVFSPSLSSTSTTWVLSGYSVQGSL